MFPSTVEGHLVRACAAHDVSILCPSEHPTLPFLQICQLLRVVLWGDVQHASCQPCPSPLQLASGGGSPCAAGRVSCGVHLHVFFINAELAYQELIGRQVELDSTVLAKSSFAQKQSELNLCTSNPRHRRREPHIQPSRPPFKHQYSASDRHYGRPKGSFSTVCLLALVDTLRDHDRS